MTSVSLGLVVFMAVCVSAQPQMRRFSFAQDGQMPIDAPIFRVEPPPMTTEEPRPTPPPLDCSIRADGNYLPPDNMCSNLYYTCTHGVSRFHRCPADTVFNTDLGDCDFKTNVKECPMPRWSPRLTPKPTTPRPTTPEMEGVPDLLPQRPIPQKLPIQPETLPRNIVSVPEMTTEGPSLPQQGTLPRNVVPPQQPQNLPMTTPNGLIQPRRPMIPEMTTERPSFPQPNPGMPNERPIAPQPNPGPISPDANPNPLVLDPKNPNYRGGMMRNMP